MEAASQTASGSMRARRLAASLPLWVLVGAALGILTGITLGERTAVLHPLACAAALSVQRILHRDAVLANVRGQGAYLARRLNERFGNHPYAGDVRGRGLFYGVELVADRGSKEPFDPQLRLHARVKQEAMVRGLMVYPMGGTADGTRGDHVLLAPPFIVDAPLVDEIVERLGEAIDAATAGLQ